MLPYGGYRIHDAAQILGGNPQRLPRNLHPAPKRRAHCTQDGRNSHETKLTDDRDLHRPVAFSPSEDRRQTPLDEVDVLDPTIERFGGYAGQQSILNYHRRSSSEMPNQSTTDIARDFSPSLAT